MLQQMAMYSPQLRLSFGDRQFFAAWHKYLPFYLAIFDHLPTLDPGCKRASSKGGGARILHFHEFGMGPSRIGPYKSFFLHSGNTTLVRSCAFLPKLHAVAAARRSTLRLGARPPQIVLLHRPNNSAGGLPGRQILNRDEVANNISELAREHGVTFIHRNIDSLEPMEQVDLLLSTDVLLSYHGSGVGSGHFWMAPGTVVVEWQPPGVPYCIFATCGAVSGKAWVESGDKRTPQMEIWKPGGWNSKWPICNPNNMMQQCHRTVDVRPVLNVLQVALSALRLPMRQPQRNESDGHLAPN